MKTFLSRLAWGEIMLGAVFACLFALPALAQNASTGPAIGPAPVNTKQHQILDTALSSQTRQTLQEAMNSARAADSAHPAPAAK